MAKKKLLTNPSVGPLSGSASAPAVKSAPTPSDPEAVVDPVTLGDEANAAWPAMSLYKSVPLRGKMVQVHRDQAVYCALLALENPKVDVVLSACNVVIRGIDGQKIWP